jgi:hypothetical protein
VSVKRKSVIAPHKRLAAARLLRQGKSFNATQRETGIHAETLSRWMKTDPDFLLLVHGQGTIQVGPVRIHADHDAPLLTDVPDESLVWIARSTETGPEVLGSVAVQDATHLRAIFVTNAEQATAELQAGRMPYDPEARTFPLRADALPALADEKDLRLLCALTSEDQEEAFRAWLDIWKFRSGEDKAIRTLGPTMWEGQRQLADTLATVDHSFVLKARKLGQSTICVSYSGFAARVRDEQARVHLFSYRERAAKRLLEQVKFGLQRLPEFLRLPIERETMQELVYDAGGDDLRTVVSYPMSKSTAVEETSTHAMLDEFADWPDNETTYGGLEPTFTADGATSTLVTTGNGPQNFAATYWNLCVDGDGLHEPIFLPASARPGRDAAWMERKRKTMTASSFRCEYAMTPADALAGSAEREFSSDDIEACSSYPRYGPNSRTGWPLGKAQTEFPRRNRRAPVQEVRYIISADIGVRDATVITVLDVTSQVYHVAHYVRRTGLTYPQIGTELTRVCMDFYPAPVVIEANSMGQSVIDHLEVKNRVIPFTTSATSKARIIQGLASALQHMQLQYDRRALPQLHNELLGYQVPDDYIVQDSVMALAIGIDGAPEAYSAKNRPGRVMSVVLA